MDSLTHIALGACMGEAFAGKTVGRKAMLWGAMAQSIPDIDFVAAFWLGTTENLLAHRGFTHSLLFCLLATPVLAYFAERWHRPHNISFRRWLAFFGSVIFVHIFLDAFNNYGVGWFEPFSKSRISFHVIYVVDFFFSIWGFIALMALIVLKKRHRHRQNWWKFGLLFTGLYLGYSIVNKLKIDHDVRKLLAAKEIKYERYFTTPAPLQNWLWFVVAGSDTGYYTGYRSIFDDDPELKLNWFPRNDTLLHDIRNKEEIENLKRFSQGFYTVDKFSDTLVFNDLRFGQVIGWYDPRERFAFHYYLQFPDENTLVVQRGRFAKWNFEVAKSLVRKVAGL